MLTILLAAPWYVWLSLLLLVISTWLQLLCWFSLFSRFLGNIREAFNKDSELKNLLMDDFFTKAIHECQVQSKLVLCNPLCLNKPTKSIVDWNLLFFFLSKYHNRNEFSIHEAKRVCINVEIIGVMATFSWEQSQ